MTTAAPNRSEYQFRQSQFLIKQPLKLNKKKNLHPDTLKSQPSTPTQQTQKGWEPLKPVAIEKVQKLPPPAVQQPFNDDGIKLTSRRVKLHAHDKNAKKAHVQEKNDQVLKN